MSALKSVRAKTQANILVILCLALTACGGGGGSADAGGALTRLTPVSGISVTLDSSSKTRAVAASATAQAMNVDSTTGNTSSNALASGVASALPLSPAPNWLELIQSTQQLAQQIASSDKVLNGVTKTGTCPGGGNVTVTYSGSYIFAAGTTTVMSMNQCALVSGSSLRLSGKLSYIGLQGTFPNVDSETVVQIEPLKIDLGTGTTTTQDGSYKLKILNGYGTSATFSVASYNGSSLTTESSSNSQSYKETASSFAWTYSISSTQLTVYGSATIDSTRPILISTFGTAAKYAWSVAPNQALSIGLTSSSRGINAGQVKITGANNATVLSSMGQTCSGGTTTNCVKMETDKDADQIYESSELLTWSDFSAKF